MKVFIITNPRGRILHVCDSEELAESRVDTINIKYRSLYEIIEYRVEQDDPKVDDV